jgi:hypothetical protein
VRAFLRGSHKKQGLVFGWLKKSAALSMRRMGLHYGTRGRVPTQRSFWPLQFLPHRLRWPVRSGAEQAIWQAYR